MTKMFNFGLKIKGVVRRKAHAKSSDPATPSPPKKLKGAQGTYPLNKIEMVYCNVEVKVPY